MQLIKLFPERLINTARRIGIKNWFIGGCLCAIMLVSCYRDRPEKYYPPRHIVYSVKGTHFKLNFIDSASVFRSAQVFQDSFRYEFLKGPGATIGISIFALTPDDKIYSWEIYVNGKLSANAFSEGGAYFTIPYN